MVIPIGDVNPVRRTPWVLRLLLLSNLVVFFAVQPWLAPACERLAFFLAHAAIPAEVVQGAPLSAGQLAGPLAACGLDPVPDKSVYVAVLTSMFLHGDPLHLLGNMLFLWIFGNNIEDRFGHLGFLTFYLLAGVVASVLFAAANPEGIIPLVGASGAIAGVLGAYLVMFPVARVTVVVVPLFFLPIQLPAMLVLGSWFLLQLRDAGGEAAVGGGVAYLAHVAGFITGVVLTLLLGYRPQRRRRRRSDLR